MRVWAICLACERSKGRSLKGAWTALLLWLAAILVGIAIATWLLGKLAGLQGRG